MRIRSLTGAVIALVILGLVAGTAFAGKGGGNRTASGSMEVLVLDGPDSVPNHTERITFTVDQTASDRPFVFLRCWQGSTGVYGKSIGIFETYMWDPWFTLDSQYWTAGVAADCSARLYYYTRRGDQKTLATKDFVVAP